MTCVFVDHGLLRKNEGDEVEAVFGPDGNYELNFIRVNAQQRYYDKLNGEMNRKKIRLRIYNDSSQSSLEFNESELIKDTRNK